MADYHTRTSSSVPQEEHTNPSPVRPVSGNDVTTELEDRRSPELLTQTSGGLQRQEEQEEEKDGRSSQHEDDEVPPNEIHMPAWPDFLKRAYAESDRATKRRRFLQEWHREFDDLQRQARDGCVLLKQAIQTEEWKFHEKEAELERMRTDIDEPWFELQSYWDKQRAFLVLENIEHQRDLDVRMWVIRREELRRLRSTIKGLGRQRQQITQLWQQAQDHEKRMLHVLADAEEQWIKQMQESRPAATRLADLEHDEFVTERRMDSHELWGICGQIFAESTCGALFWTIHVGGRLTRRWLMTVHGHHFCLSDCTLESQVQQALQRQGGLEF